MKKIVSAVIPGKNEAANIGGVLKVVTAHPMIDEVIVINDGSTDKTGEIAASFPKVKLINHKVNTGKTLAVKEGIEKSSGDIIVMIDADLKQIKEHNLTDLITPVLNDEVDLTLSMRHNSYIFKPFKIDFISGERALKREVLQDPLIWSKPHIGFGLEVLMNKSILKKGYTYKSVYFPNVNIAYKWSKVGYIQGTIDTFKMIGEMKKAVPLGEIWQELMTMSKNQVR